MAADAVERKLAAILSADAVGYSRLMGEDEDATLRTLAAHRFRIERIVETFRGRVVDAPGDNVLVEFPSAVGALRCAIEIQRALAVENAEFEEPRRMLFRIGLHLGDVLVDGEKIYGDGINIAARLEGLAEAGGICLSDLVYQQVRRHLELAVSDLGDRELKNIASPVRVYQISPGSILGGEVRPRGTLTAPSAPADKPSLAVLPFFNMNGDRTQDYFSDGLTADIMAELVRIPGLFLISADSMFTYQTAAAKPREVARELGVRHVLEGTVRRERDRIRITAQLVEAASGRHQWAERYDRELEDVFAVQDEIAEQVVTEMDVALVGGEGARTTRQHLRDPHALNLLYKGWDLLQHFTRADLAEARSLFGEVIRIVPECPFGYLDAAMSYYYEVERSWSESPAESLERMSELSHRSIDLGDVSGIGHLMLGHVHLMKREHDEALALADEALRERPSCQLAYGLKANILNYTGQAQDAIALAKQAIRLSPVAQTLFPEVLAAAYYLAGRFEEAMTAAHQALALAPDSVDSRVVLAASLVETGRLEAAKEAAREILSVEPEFTLQRFAASQPYREEAELQRFVAPLRHAGLRHGGDLAVTEASSVGWATPRKRVAPRPRR